MYNNIAYGTISEQIVRINHVICVAVACACVVLCVCRRSKLMAWVRRVRIVWWSRKCCRHVSSKSLLESHGDPSESNESYACMARHALGAVWVWISRKAGLRSTRSKRPGYISTSVLLTTKLRQRRTSVRVLGVWAQTFVLATVHLLPPALFLSVIRVLEPVSAWDFQLRLQAICVSTLPRG